MLLTELERLRANYGNTDEPTKPAIQAWFRGVKHFPRLAQLMRIAERGVPVRVNGDGDLISSARCANHSSSVYADSLIQKIQADVLVNRIFVIPRSAS